MNISKKLFLILWMLSFTLNVDSYQQNDVLSKQAANYIKQVVKVLENGGNLDFAKNSAKQVLAIGNSYDKSVAFNYLAYIAFSENNYEEAAIYYEMLLDEPGGTLELREATIYTLSQLYFTFDAVNKTFEMLEIEALKQGSTKKLCLSFYRLMEQAKLDLSDHYLSQKCPLYEISPIQRASPKYPKKALNRGQSGNAILFMNVNEDGKPFNVEFIEGNCTYESQDKQLITTSCDEFKKSSLKAARGLRFESSPIAKNRGLFHTFTYILED